MIITQQNDPCIKCLDCIEEQGIPTFAACADKLETAGDSGQEDIKNKQENPNDRMEQISEEELWS